MVGGPRQGGEGERGMRGPLTCVCKWILCLSNQWPKQQGIKLTLMVSKKRKSTKGEEEEENVLLVVWC